MWVEAVSTWDLPQQKSAKCWRLVCMVCFLLSFISGCWGRSWTGEVLRFSLKERPLQGSWLTESAAQFACAKPHNLLTLALLPPSLLHSQAVPAAIHRNAASRMGPAIWHCRVREKEQQLPGPTSANSFLLLSPLACWLSAAGWKFMTPACRFFFEDSLTYFSPVLQ